MDRMTKPLTVLAPIAAFFVILWLTVGGPWLAAIVGAITLITLIFGAFTVGSWWSAKLMREGAEIALQAQISDDKRDSVLIREIGQLARKFGDQSQLPNGDGYPLLPETVDGSFTIAGLDADSEES